MALEHKLSLVLPPASLSYFCLTSAREVSRLSVLEEDVYMSRKMSTGP